jgi:hypothetical protein
MDLPMRYAPYKDKLASNQNYLNGFNEEISKRSHSIQTLRAGLKDEAPM